MPWKEVPNRAGFRSLVVGMIVYSVIILVGVERAPAASVHYISASGADSNDGMSKASPWQHAPGMQTCTANCGSYNPVAGDRFIFKGGDTWAAANFPDMWPSGGSSGNPIYIGVDQTWYTGSSWRRPVFDGGNANLSSTENLFLDLRNKDYITVDNIEFTNFAATNWSSYATCGMIQTDNDTNITIENIYVHNFAVDANSGGNCFVVHAPTYPPFGGNTIVKNSVIAGDGNAYMEGISGVGYVIGNVIHDIPWMIFPYSQGEIANNLLYNCGYPSFPPGATGMHGDAIQINNATGTYYVHDNVIHDTGYDAAGGSECEASLYGNPTETDYVWNNVLYNIHGNSFALTQASNPGVAAYFWNNTIEGGQDGANYCIRAGHGGSYSTIVIQNNHCISNQSQVNDPALSASTLTVSNNLVQTAGAADANTSPQFDQYSASQTYAFSVVASTNSTVGAGTNLSAQCSGATAGLCSDTGYGCTAQSVNGVVQSVCPARTPVARPTSGVWGVGAYEGMSKAPLPPTGVTNVAK